MQAPEELDAVAADAFAATLEQPGAIVVDCGAIEFIDSSGLRVLLEANERAIRDGETFVLRAPSTVLRRLLTITSTDEVFTIEP